MALTSGVQSGRCYAHADFHIVQPAANHICSVNRLSTGYVLYLFRQKIAVQKLN